MDLWSDFVERRVRSFKSHQVCQEHILKELANNEIRDAFDILQSVHIECNHSRALEFTIGVTYYNVVNMFDACATIMDAMHRAGWKFELQEDLDRYAGPTRMLEFTKNGVTFIVELILPQDQSECVVEYKKEPIPPEDIVRERVIGIEIKCPDAVK